MCTLCMQYTIRSKTTVGAVLALTVMGREGNKGKGENKRSDGLRYLKIMEIFT